MLAARLLRVLPRAAPRRGLACFPLEGRALLRLHGPDTEPFLQGLLTNDMARMRSGERALYAHLLNVQGRTLYDVILYRYLGSQEEGLNILLECDTSALDSIQKHLKVYKIRRKVNLAPCPELSLWAVLPNEQAEDVPTAFETFPDSAGILTPDPRVAAMGWRLVTSKDQHVPDVVPGTQIGNNKDYHKYRYNQGIPEGVKDLPPGVALPLESNLAYMNGISFSKGCYIGQELTARTHHTGVIRKRLMPVQLLLPQAPGLHAVPGGAEVLTPSGKSAGKYRAGEEAAGLALLRLAHINEQLRVRISEDSFTEVTTRVPEWWPQDTDN